MLTEKLIELPQESLSRIQRYIVTVINHFKEYRPQSLHNYTKRFKFSLSNTPYKQYKDIPIIIKFIYDSEQSHGTTDTDGRTITIEINLANTKPGHIKWVLEHEMLHAFQLWASKASTTADITRGLPKRHIRSKQPNIIHALKDVEYYPNLATYAHHIKNTLKTNPNLEPGDIIRYLLGGTPERSKLESIIFDTLWIKKYFDQIKHHDYERWKSLMKDLYKVLLDGTNNDK